MPGVRAQARHRARQLHRRARRRRPPLRPGGRWAGRSGGDCRQAALRGAQGHRPLLRRNRAGQRRSGADSRSRLDCPEGRRHHDARKKRRARRRKTKPTPPRASNTCWSRSPDARPRCRWPTCCASSSFRSRASSTSATGRCSTSRANCCRSRIRAACWPRRSESAIPEAQIIVVVCREGNRHVGIAVSHVLDVAAGGDLFEAGTSQRTGGVTLLKNRVTGVVDLGGVAPLPASEERASRMEPDSGDSGMSTATVALHRKEKAAAHWWRCVRCAWARRFFGVPITHILEIVGSARPQPVPLAPGLCRRAGSLPRRRADHGEPAPVAGSAAEATARRTFWCWRAPADALACWWIRSARCSPSRRPTTSPTHRFSTSAAERCSPALTSSRTACWSCSTLSSSTPCG